MEDFWRLILVMQQAPSFCTPHPLPLGLHPTPTTTGASHGHYQTQSRRWWQWWRARGHAGRGRYPSNLPPNLLLLLLIAQTDSSPPPPPPPPPFPIPPVRATQVVGAAVRGGTGLMAVMVLQRGTNFVLNQLLLRYVDPAVFGLASVPLDLLLNTALFLSREGFRLALGRQTLVGLSSDAPAFRQFVNMSWLPALLGPLVSLLSLALLPTTGGKGTVADAAVLRQTGLLYCLAAALESVSEPAYLISQGCLLTTLRAASEGLATLGRSAVTFVLLAWVLPPQQALLAFGIAQVCYSLMLVAVYWFYLLFRVGVEGEGTHKKTKKKEEEKEDDDGKPRTPLRLLALRHLLPGPPSAGGEQWVDRAQLSLAGALTGQSFFKHLLTQGDKIVLSLGSSHYSQGMYALAQNYGSLAARLFFQPVEESGRLMFARLAANATTATATEAEVEGEAAGKRQSKLAIHASPKTTLGLILGALVKTVVLVGLVVACFGFNYTRVLLRVLLPGKRWAGQGGRDEASHVLSWYCLYVLFLAVNGMTEAFMYAVATHAEVAFLSLSAAASFLVFAGLTLPLMQAYGTIGLVLANSLGMLVRICFSLNFIRSYFKRPPEEPLPDMFPHPAVLASFVAAFAGTMASDCGLESLEDLGAVVPHVLFGVGALASLLTTVYFVEGEFLGDLKGIRRLALGRKGEEKEA